MSRSGRSPSSASRRSRREPRAPSGGRPRAPASARQDSCTRRSARARRRPAAPRNTGPARWPRRPRSERRPRSTPTVFPGAPARDAPRSSSFRHPPARPTHRGRAARSHHNPGPPGRRWRSARTRSTRRRRDNGIRRPDTDHGGGFVVQPDRLTEQAASATDGAQGREGPVEVVFTVVPRREIRSVLAAAEEWDPDAFITIEEPREIRRGWMDSTPRLRSAARLGIGEQTRRLGRREIP